MLRFKLALTVTLTFCLFLTNLTAQFSNSSETGPVGFYSSKFQGSRTALGALYDENQMTCAHKFYPTGTLLQISRIDNDLSVVVEVNDRLSVKSNNVVRISKIATQELNIDPTRIAIVRIDPLGKPKNNTPTVYYNTSPSAAFNASDDRLTAKGVAIPQAYDAVYQQPVPVAERAPNKLQFPTVFGGSPAPPSSPAPQSYDNIYSRSLPSAIPPGRPSNTTTIRVIPQVYDNLTARGITANTPPPTAYEATANTSLRNLTVYYVQVAAFANYDNAEQYAQNLLRRGISNVNTMQTQKQDGRTIFRMWIGPYPNAAVANTEKKSLASNYSLRGLVVEGN